MKSLSKLILAGSLSLALVAPAGLAAQGAQTGTYPKGNPPAASDTKAKTTHGAMHRTTGTIASIDAGKVVLNQTVKGKTEEVTIMLGPDTTKVGALKTGDRVTVRWHEMNNQKIATSIREVSAGTARSKPSKTEPKAAPKS